MAAEPYWSVGPHDVFPEQFERFLVADPHSRAVFMQFHGGVYRSDDAGHTWSGFGPKPGWFKQALAAGKTPESLAA